MSVQRDQCCHLCTFDTTQCCSVFGSPPKQTMHAAWRGCILTTPLRLQVQQLVDMGFSYETVSQALLSSAGDANAALERLLGS